MNSSAHASSRGFTLLEIMVVMVIIGIIATMATLSIGVASRDQGPAKEIQRIDDLLALAGEQAVLQGREYGLTFYAHQYEFSTYDYAAGLWVPVDDDNLPLTERKLPPDAVVDLFIDGRPVSLASEAPKKGKKKPAKPKAGEPLSQKEKDKRLPQVFILSSGDVTPFELRLRPAVGQPGISLRVTDNGETKQVHDEK